LQYNLHRRYIFFYYIEKHNWKLTDMQSPLTLKFLYVWGSVCWSYLIVCAALGHCSQNAVLATVYCLLHLLFAQKRLSFASEILFMHLLGKSVAFFLCAWDSKLQRSYDSKNFSWLKHISVPEQIFYLIKCNANWVISKLVVHLWILYQYSWNTI
jgi:hypothetical protein